MVLLIPFLVSLFFSFSLGELARINVADAVSIGIVDVLLGFIVLLWWIFVKKGEYTLRNPIFIFVVVSSLSLILNFKNFTSSQILISSLYLFRWIFYSALYFVLADIGKLHTKLINKCLVACGAITLALGFAQFTLYPELRNLYYLGWDEHTHRLFSSFLDPNFTGIIIVLYLVFIFNFRNELFKNKKITYSLIFLSFCGLVLTYSRGAILMFISCALTYSVIQRNVKILLGTFAVLAFTFVLLIPGFKVESTNLLRTTSSKDRIASSAKALTIFQENPLGVGFNTYRYAREKYGDKDKSEFGPSHSGAGVDNSFVFVLVTSGIEGLLAYLYLISKMLGLGWKNLKSNKFAVVLFVSLIGLIVNSLTINSLFYSFIMIWIWIMAGLTENSSRE